MKFRGVGVEGQQTTRHVGTRCLINGKPMQASCGSQIRCHMRALASLQASSASLGASSASLGEVRDSDVTLLFCYDRLRVVRNL